MANYAGTGAIFEVRSTATAGNVNGGAFNPANANFIADFAATSATGNSPVLTSASYNFVAGDVGAWIYVKSGTNWTSGFYQIASVAANAATLSAAIGQAVQLINNRYIANTVAGIATVASPTSGTCGIDYSQQDAARYSGTDITGSTTTCTSASTPFTTQMAGNFICMASGTGVTAGWYEIVSVSVVTATLDRSAGATYSSVVYKTGGAISLGGSTAGINDSNFFAQGSSSTTSACTRFIKGGSSITYSIAVAVSSPGAGNALWNRIIEGYNSLRGDRPQGTTRPTLAMGANNYTEGPNTTKISLIFTGTSGAMVTESGGSCTDIYCKFKTSGSGQAVIAGQQGTFIACEAQSYGGIAIDLPASFNDGLIMGCYIHDSVTGLNSASSSGFNLVNSIFATCTTTAVVCGNPGTTLNYSITGCTFYGAENKLGTGISIGSFTGTYPGVAIYNNIFYGFTTAISPATVNAALFGDYNDFFNNTNDVVATNKWQKGANDLAVNPSFTSVSQVTGTGGSSTGTTFTDGSKNFTTAGVVAGRDFIRVVSGTGSTLGIFGITVVGTTTLTTDNALGTNSSNNAVYQITTGRNFAVGTALKATAYPGAFPGALTTGYLDIGAVQRQEPASGGAYTFGF